MDARRADGLGQSFPFASLAVAAACCIVLIITGPRMEHETRALHGALTRAAELFLAHPDLEVPSGCAARGRFVRMRADTRFVASAHEQPPEGERGVIEARLAELCDEVAELERTGFAARFGFVPAHGLAQAGWLTHLFVHAGWLHLAMNLAFLLLLAPPLEARAGSLRVLAVLLLGGLAAAGAHATALAGSAAPLVGLSGGVAALVALHALRLGRARVAPFGWTRVPGVMRTIPGWFPVALWLANEGYHFAVHGVAGGVSYFAHAGGIAVGVIASRWVHA